MKTQGVRRWRRALARANRLRDASRLPDVTDRDIAIIQAGLKGWYWDNPYFTDETLYAAASLALDGMPASWPRGVPRDGKGRAAK